MPPLPPSRRGQQNVRPDLMIDLSRKLAQNTYDKKTNPDGIVDLGSATNELVLDELQKWLKKNETPEDRTRYLKYNDTQSSPDLPAAAAVFMNHFFHASLPLTTSNILVANGVTALLDTLFFNLADEGDVILFPTPSYGMFTHDVTTRNGLHMIGVPCDDITKARFRQHVRPGRPRPELINRLSQAAEDQRTKGRRVVALLIANPENPLGCCYSREILRYLVDFCRREGMHFVVDEIYALSGGANFTSVLSLNLGEHAQNVHVLWGMSKDLGLGGCRIGFLATYNEQLYRTMRTCSMFTWVSAFGGIVSTKLLSDTEFVANTYLPMFHKALGQRKRELNNILTANQIPYTVPDAAFFVFVDLSRWLSNFDGEDTGREIALLEYLMDRGVFLEPGQAFSSTYPGYFRLSYGSADAVFNLGVQRLVPALRELDGEEAKVRVTETVSKRGGFTSLRPFSCFNFTDN